MYGLSLACKDLSEEEGLLFRIHVIVEMVWWTGVAPWVFEFPFSRQVPANEGCVPAAKQQGLLKRSQSHRDQRVLTPNP